MINRREFICQSAIAASTGPLLLTSRKSGTEELIIGEGDYRYRVHHGWPQLPSEFSWQVTHNVAVDSNDNLYVIHEGRSNQKEHPSIFVFDNSGKYIRSFGSQFQGGGHGIEVRQEGSEEFLYVCAYKQIKAIAKLTLRGEVVWKKNAPMASGVYAKNEDTKPENVWGRDRFMPTNIAFLNDGEFLLADGYGSYYIHHYDGDGNWKRCFGGPGGKDGKFRTPHGIWIDRRDSDSPKIVVCDRAKHQLQHFTLSGEHISTQKGFGLPANIDILNDIMLVPELHARVSLLDKENKVVAKLGADVERVTSEDGKGIRGNPKRWVDGKFIHPHDACFDQNGNIFVAEWVNTGRVTKLEKLA